MQINRLPENPFELNKASDFSDTEIYEQWVDYDPGGLLRILQPRLRMPMLLLGGKGSGKTHLMRYCSAPVQAVRHGGDLPKAIAEEGYLGVYVQVEGLNTDKFSTACPDPVVGLQIFSMYFELWLATVLIETLQLGKSNSAQGDESSFVKAVLDLFDIKLEGNPTNIAELLETLKRQRKAIDFAVNNSSLTGSLDDVKITFSTGQLIYGIPKLAGKFFGNLENTLFVYLIDEVENLTEEQQRFLNSLIRYRTGNATIKVGARLYGIKTYKTLGAGEPIKRDAEYERVELDALLREDRENYERLVSRLVLKRLKVLGVSSQHEKLDVFANFFDTLESTNYWKAADSDLETVVQSSTERPYLKKLISDLVNTGRTDEEQAKQIADMLRLPDHIYLEKASVFQFRKRWPKKSIEALKLADVISKEALSLKEGRKDSENGLAGTISYFGSDILAQLYQDFRRPVPYTGFRTLIDLSQGIPRNLLTNLKHIYRRSLFANEKPFAGGKISVKSQADGVKDGATWFWEDAQPDSQGLGVREAIEALATLFRTVRFSSSPSECDLCTFSVEIEKLNTASKDVLKIAENWSYLIRLPNGRPNKNTYKLDERFQLSPMLAPKWGVSEHRRGSIEFSTEFANAIFDPSQRNKLVDLFKRRVEGMLSSSAAPASSIGGLFKE